MSGIRERFIFMNLTVGDLQPEKLFYVTKILCNISHCLALWCFPFAVYIILIKSPKHMTFYKYLLIVQLVSAILVNMLLFATNPVIILPFWIGYFDGPITFNYEWSKAMAVIIVLCLVLFGNATGAQVTYRQICYLDEGIFKLLAKPPIFVISAVAVFLVCILIILGVSTMTIMDIKVASDPDMHSLALDFPVLDFVFKKHLYAMGYTLDSSNVLKLVCTLLWYGMMGMIPLVVLLMMVMIFMMQRLKKHLPLHKYRLHTMLSRTLLVQLFATFTFMVTAFILFMSSVKYQFKGGVIFLCMAKILASMHAFADICIQMIFIKPYRRFLLKKFRIRLNFAKLAADTSTENPVAQAS